MAKKFFSKYTNSEIETILDNSKTSVEKPFWLYYDKNTRMYRMFSTEDKQKAYIADYEAGKVAGTERSEYEFTEPFLAPAPNTMVVDMTPTTMRYFIENDDEINISFRFSTIDGKSVRQPEAVDVYLMFSTPTGTRSLAKIFQCNVTEATTLATINIKDYVSVGDNVVTMVVKGRSTSASKMETIDIHLLSISISTDFDVALTRENGKSFDFTYTLKGSPIQKVVQVWVDGTSIGSRSSTKTEQIQTFEVPSSYGTTTFGPGKHTLRVRASMTMSDNGTTFHTPTLIYEYVTLGTEQTHVMLESSVTEGDTPATGDPVKIYARQYELKSINWGFYTSVENRKTNGYIRWELQKTKTDDDGTHIETTVLMSEKTQLVVDSNDRHQSPLQFVPTETGTFKLHAIYEKEENGVVIISDDLTGTDGYEITISENQSGVEEATENMILKLTAMGRSNDEPSASIANWSYTYASGIGSDGHTVYTTYSTTFHDQYWSGSNGWDGTCLRLANGAWCECDAKPFADDVCGDQFYGVAFEIDFETYNVTDSNVTLMSISDERPSSERTYSTRFYVTPQSAVLVGSMGNTITVNFKANERVKISFIVYPRNHAEYPQSAFAVVNGVISYYLVYGSGENFDIGRLNVKDTDPSSLSDVGKIKIGDPEGLAAIKIYSIRSYKRPYTFKSALSNFLIDHSGSELSKAIARNDIYNHSTGEISYDVMCTRITTILVTGDLESLIGGSRTEGIVYCAMSLVSPDNPTINFTCNNAKITIAGQSTRGKPVPSFHVKFQDPSANKLLDVDGNLLPNNRWAFKAGNVPEKKFRLQANYMDSSCCHNAAFLRLYNDIIENFTVNGEHVLLAPAQKYALSLDEYSPSRLGGYREAMKARYPDKEDPTGNDWAFPYKFNLVPDSIPCVVMYRKKDGDRPMFLGQYVIMEEKKADFSSCKRSIYDTVDVLGRPDPFKFASDGGTRLWNNSNCRQFEIVKTGNLVTFFIDDAEWEKRHTDLMEMIYPDPDDVAKDYDKTGISVEDYWKEFYDDFMKQVIATSPRKMGSKEAAQAAFDALYVSGLLNRWHFATYYALMMRNCCVDSIVKNIELTTFDRVSWFPKWWDVDMQCGMEQTAQCDVPPKSNRESKKPGTDNYYFDGKYIDGGELVSSWLWDGLEGCAQFKADVLVAEQALFDAQWTYNNLTSIQDEEYVAKWAESVYNESQYAKYMDPFAVENPAENAVYVQGDRTPHRHWFLRTSYDYYDALHVCGDYKDNKFRFRTSGVRGQSVWIVPYEDSFFGWGDLNTPQETGIYGRRGEPLAIKIILGDHSITTLSNQLNIYNSPKISKLDLSEIAVYIQGEVDFSTASQDGVNNLTTLTFGMSSVSALSSASAFNIGTGYADALKGLNSMTRLEELSIRGMFSFTATDKLGISNMPELSRFYAAGTRLTEFKPYRGAPITDVELPTTLKNITIDGSSLTDSSGNCLIKWYDTISLPLDITETFTQSASSLDIGVVDSDTASSIAISAIEFGCTDSIPFSGLSGLTFDYFLKTVGATVPQRVVQTTAPSGITVMSFSGVGSDIGTHKLILEWLRAVDAVNPNHFQMCEFVYHNMSWGSPYTPADTPMPLADLMRIAKIPVDNGKRNITGYIRCDAGPSGFTTQQMSEILNAFGHDSRGNSINVFDRGSSLCIDCTAVVIIISAETNEFVSVGQEGSESVINVLQGKSAQITVAGFPLTTDAIEYKYEILDGSNWYSGAQDGDDTVNYGADARISFNRKSGLISTRELDLPDTRYTFRVIKTVGGNSVQKTFFVDVKARTYPNRSDITYDPGAGTILNNEYQILASGNYKFGISFSVVPSGTYNGTLSSTNGGEWFITSNYSRISEFANIVSSSATSATISVSRMPTELDGVTEIHFLLGQISHWSNTIALTSHDYMRLCIATNVKNIVVFDETTGIPSYGNGALYMALEKAGFEHDSSTTIPRFPYDSQQLKFIPSGVSEFELNFRELLDGVSPVLVDNFNYLSSNTINLTSPFNALRFLKNVSILNFEGCSGLHETVDVWGTTGMPNVIDIAGMDNYTKLYMQGTGAGLGVNIGTNSKLRELYYGTPKHVSIVSPSYLNKDTVDVENTSLIEDITLFKIPGNGNQHTTTFGLYSKIIKGGCPNLSSIDVSSGTANTETVSGDDIEAIAAKMRELTSVGGHIGVYGKVFSQRAYRDSCEYLSNNLNNFGTFSATANQWYVRWADRNFERALCDSIVSDDGVGVLPTRVATLTGMFGAIRNNAAVKDLSDFGYFKSFSFRSYDVPASSEFYGCTGLTTITIPTTAAYIGKNSFPSQGSSLKTVNISGCTTLARIETGAFVACASVTSDFNLSNSASTLVSADMTGLPNAAGFTMVGSNKFKRLVI